MTPRGEPDPRQLRMESLQATADFIQIGGATAIQHVADHTVVSLDDIQNGVLANISDKIMSYHTLFSKREKNKAQRPTMRPWDKKDIDKERG